MNYIAKRIIFIVLGIFMLFCTGFWLMACLFAVGQLYDTYNLWVYLKDAPVAVAILVGLLAAAVVFFVLAFKVKKPPVDQQPEDPGYRYKDE